MKETVYEIGVAEITAPHKVIWTGQTVSAFGERGAFAQAEKLGFYRNVRLRTKEPYAG